jgi:hypothetical protein
VCAINPGGRYQTQNSVFAIYESGWIPALRTQFRNPGGWRLGSPLSGHAGAQRRRPSISGTVRDHSPAVTLLSGRLASETALSLVFDLDSGMDGLVASGLGVRIGSARLSRGADITILAP